MGTAGAEGFGSSFHGLDVEDAGKDETIRDKDGETGHNDIDAHHNEKYQLIDVGTCAGELRRGNMSQKKWLMMLPSDSGFPGVGPSILPGEKASAVMLTHVLC